MQVRELSVGGAWEFTPPTHGDARGLFFEWYRADVLRESTGRDLGVAQANQSVSVRGVLRGVHASAVPPGQAKYVYCPLGAVLDVIVDLRVGSPTFGKWDAVRLDDTERRAVFISEGLGHAFMSLTGQAAVAYLCSSAYDPAAEFGVDPLDQQLDLPWPADVEPILSERDRTAPSLAEAQAAGVLPDYAHCRALYGSLRG